MTIQRDKSKPLISNNIQELIKMGRPQKQAVAIAQAQARRIGARLPKLRKRSLPKRKSS